MPARGKKAFKVRLESVGPSGAWVYIRIPLNVEEAFGSRARISVRGTINGFAFRCSIFPDGRGAHTMMVNKTMQAGARAKPGDTVRVVMASDTAPRIVSVPADFRRVLAGTPRARVAFQKLSPSHRKEYVDWITSAKKKETRAARVKKSLRLLAAGKPARS